MKETQEMRFQSLDHEDPLEEEMKWQLTPIFLPGGSQGHMEPGGLQSMGSQSWTQLSAYTHTHTQWIFTKSKPGLDFLYAVEHTL